MTFNVFSWVLDNSEAKHGDRLVLLVLAEHAHRDGSKAFPGVPTIAHEARLSERQVTASLGKLEKVGAIQHTDTTRGGVKAYRVLMTDDAANLRGVKDSQGAESGADGVKDPTQGGEKSASAHIKEPPANHQGNHARRSAPSREEAPLSHLLADLIARNDPDGSRPEPGKTWADAERLLQTKDGRSPAQIELVVRWCMDDHFEQSNVLSMPKLRKRYRQLLSKTTKAPNRKPGSAASKADHDIRRYAELAEQLKKEGR